MRKNLSLALLLASSVSWVACNSSDAGTDADDASAIVDPDAGAASDDDSSTDSDGSGDEAVDADGEGNGGNAEGGTAPSGDTGLSGEGDTGTGPDADAGASGGGPAMDASATDAGGADADIGGDANDAGSGIDGGQSDAEPSTYLCGQLPQPPDVLLDLGGSLSAIGRTPTRVLTVGGVRWVLWDASTRAQINSGLTDANVSMGGDYFTAHVGADVEVRALGDGRVVSRAVGIGSAQLAVDGSYLWTLNGSQQLRAWSREGTPLVDKSGYAGSNVVFAAHDELRVARNLNTDNVIATVSTVTGATTISSPYSGAFRAWFDDGEHFLTSATGIVRVYSKTASAPQLFAVTPSDFQVGGSGDHFWITASNYVAIYRLGSTAPVFQAPQSAVPHTAGSRVWLTHFAGQERVLEVFDFSGPTVGRTTTPVTWDVGVGVVFGDASGGWAGWDGRCNSVSVGDIDEPNSAPRPVGCGTLSGIAGSEVGRIALLTCDRIFWFNVSGGARQLEGSLAINALQSLAKIALSRDGTVLAVTDGRSIKLYGLPSGTLLHDITYPLSSGGWPFELSFVFSDSGNVLGQYKCDGAEPCERFATLPDGANTVFNGGPTRTSVGGDLNSRFWSFAISPSDARFAVANGGRNTSTASLIYEGNALTGAADGYLVDWLSNEQLLVNRYRIDRFGPGGYSYTMAQVVDRTGAVLRDLTLPHLSSITRMANGRIYGRQTNRIYSTADASVLWSSPNRASSVVIDGVVGDVAGDRVVFLSGTPYTSGGAPAVTSHLLRSEAY